VKDKRRKKSEKTCVRRFIHECKQTSDPDSDSPLNKEGSILNHHLEERTEVV